MKPTDHRISERPADAPLDDGKVADLERKYREERDRRLQAVATAAVDLSGELGRLLKDPNAEAIQRSPIVDEQDVIIIGGGHSGILSAASLKEAGIDRFRLIEAGSGFGGVWYWNRYPGVACDVESYIYMPFLEDTDYIPTQKYAQGYEIRGHFERIAAHFGLHDHACFGTQVTGVEWIEAESRWLVTTNRQDRMKARFVFLGSGGLSHPKLPAIPGIETFKGHIFHTSRWDYHYTSGDHFGNLTRLRDKRIAIIGTGATAIQAVPHLGEWAQKLYVVQRTPAIVAPRDNRPTDPSWASELQPGWQKRRIENFDAVLAGAKEQDLVGDAWSDIWGPPDLAGVGLDASDVKTAIRTIDFAKMEAIRARIDTIVDDPRTAEALKPYYYRFCKRPCFHDEYLQTFNRPNVELIDTRGRGLDRVTEKAIVFDGKSHAVDAIICATGFDIGLFTQKEGGLSLTGRDGMSIDDKWASGFLSLHGIYMHGFPNLFFIGNQKQSKPTNNIPYMLAEKARHSAAIVKRLLDDGLVMEVTAQAEADWKSLIAQKPIVESDYLAGCTPSYFNEKSDDSSVLRTLFSGTPDQYIRLLADWRENGFLGDVHISKAKA